MAALLLHTAPPVGKIESWRVTAGRVRPGLVRASNEGSKDEEVESKRFVCVNRYKVSDADAERRFREVVARREEGMRSMEGFVSHELREEGDGVFTVEQMYGGGCTLLRPTIHLWNVRTEGKGGRAWRRWESKQCYERWMKSEERRKSHFGSGVWQFKTTDKHQVPEEFIPFVFE